MQYRKLSRETRHRRSILANITRDVIMNEAVVTTEARAKEVRKFVDKMITYGKRGTLVSRRKALAFLYNDSDVVNKVFNELAKRYETVIQELLSLMNAMVMMHCKLDLNLFKTILRNSFFVKQSKLISHKYVKQNKLISHIYVKLIDFKLKIACIIDR